MFALLVVDVQNEFSPGGLRTVPNHSEAMTQIHRRIDQARSLKLPIAWVKHYNRPSESKAFIPYTWGAEFSPEIGPRDGFGPEQLFEKDVFGAFSGTELEGWLRSFGVKRLLIVGFYTHMCMSTSSREALIRGFEVYLDKDATGARDLEESILGLQEEKEVRRSALLHLINMGAHMADSSTLSGAESVLAR